MIATLTLGLILFGAALGAGVAWYSTAGRGFARGAAAGIIGGSALAGAALFYFIVAPAATDSWAERQARTDLLAIPVYAVLEKYEPIVFERLLAEYERVVRDPARIDEYTDVANTEISSIATKHIAHASDAAVLALMQDMLDKLQLLRARSPEDCYRYLFPKAAGPPELARWFERASQSHTFALMADVIRTSSESPVQIPPRERVEPLLGPIINGIYAQYGESTSLLSRAEEPGVNHATVCAVSVTLYEKVMQLPPADAAAVIRTMTQM